MTDREAFLALSDERDQWHKLLLAAEQAAYKRGFEDGWRKESEDYYSEREWRALQPNMGRLEVRSYTEMEEVRYGEGGRLMAGVPKDGDYTGGPVEW